MTPEQARELYETHGKIREAARAAGMSKSAFHRLLKKAPESLKGVSMSQTEEGTIQVESTSVRTLDDLIKACGVDPDDWRVSKWLANKWESYAGTDEDGQPRTVDLWQVKAWLERVPEWHGLSIEIEPVKRRPPSDRARPACTILTIPDTQIGFRRREDGSLSPMHDRAAISAALQLAELIQPDVIIALGDMLDLAPFGKYSVSPGLRFTTMPSLVELHAMFADLRDACPWAEIIMLEGNHEARIAKTLTDVASGEYMDLRPVDELNQDPALSLDRLLALDKLDVKFVKGYGSPYFHSGIMFHHGHIVRARGGKTVSAVLANATCSQVFGHIHRLEYAERRILDSRTGKPRRIFAFSPGALTNHEEVPHSGGSPVLDWQQGVGIIYTDADGAHCHPIPIHGGKLYHEGVLITGSDGVPDRLKDLPIPF